ncbi:ORF130 p10 [Spodoptera exigua multiple nucleopolyhedrovirus]|uniref:Protein p10 n=2 Tax=Spodoptera exigua multiple nucleopolyhedrovirus TaxID=10454 RepID=VP10_NPVSE|nr:ORF130 p10 [Spodoptera exigua multiple nucleopolyhedrovirus]P34052.1 RecName: Full=Protein p10; AltName: Full=Fibrous body protein [Spodoptera exigua nuclear polyhedrosis virus (strain US)]AAF33659.1 ORF130 p10 [Spodoptera exigua multiple nucleopolyhedrovirus]ABD73805.1 P10 [Spodoptera exigua multiple nucleopolyhedrovirus]QKO28858.1 p10 [Spodoptera exigua multiple nucleopolyhedrovirus]UWK31651.1 p10 [Spodoptera exigua multiple nucleopolyhedrovirus]
MSQNILLLIRADIKAVDEKVDALQQAVNDVSANLPDTSELSAKLDAQATTLDTIVTQVNNINDVLNPDLPDVPGNLQKQQQQKKSNKK